MANLNFFKFWKAPLERQVMSGDHMDVTVGETVMGEFCAQVMLSVGEHAIGAHLNVEDIDAVIEELQTARDLLVRAGPGPAQNRAKVLQIRPSRHR